MDYFQSAKIFLPLWHLKPRYSLHYWQQFLQPALQYFNEFHQLLSDELINANSSWRFFYPAMPLSPVVFHERNKCLYISKINRLITDSKSPNITTNSLYQDGLTVF